MAQGFVQVLGPSKLSAVPAPPVATPRGFRSPFGRGPARFCSPRFVVPPPDPEPEVEVPIPVVTYPSASSGAFSRNEPPPLNTPSKEWMQAWYSTLRAEDDELLHLDLI